jgi:hypothetical protein
MKRTAKDTKDTKKEKQECKYNFLTPDEKTSI